MHALVYGNLLSIVTVSPDREWVREAEGARGVGRWRESHATGAGVVEHRRREDRGESEVEVRRGRDVRGQGGSVNSLGRGHLGRGVGPTRSGRGPKTAGIGCPGRIIPAGAREIQWLKFPGEGQTDRVQERS